MAETLRITETTGEDERRMALRGLLSNTRDLVQVAEQQGHADTALQDLPPEVIEEQYQLRHPASDEQAE